MHNGHMEKACVLLSVALMVGAWPWAMLASPVGTAPPQPMDGGRALPTFTNVSDSVGLAGVGGTFFDWVDYNNDGFLDFMMDGHWLYQNSGPPGWTFTDVTAAKGLTNAWGRAVFGDYNNDGYVDLYEADWSDKLYRNNGPPNYDFTDVTVAAGNVRDGSPGTAASWGDYNNDGFLDLYVANGEVWHADNTATYYPDTFWKNNGNGTFKNVTAASGVDEGAHAYYGRGATWADYNLDGWQDLYVSNYRISPNYLYTNNGNGTFTEVGKKTGAAGHGRNSLGKPADVYYGHTIGSSWGDLDNDGLLDIVVANLAHKDPDRGKFCDDSNIFINQGFPYWNFTDIRNTSGIPIKPIGGVINNYYDDENWANAAIADFDNDGYLDFYVPQVYNFTWMYSYLYHNEGDLTFKNVSHQLGLDNVVDTYAGAWGDYNNDGNMDLLTAGRQNQWGKVEVTNPARARLYKNSGISNHWLKVGLIGVQSNKEGVGAQVTAKVGSKSIMRQVETGMGSHGQQNDLRLNFGLGSATKADTLEVRWPSGIIQVINNVQADQWINITEDVSGPGISSLTANPTSGFPDTQINLQAQVTGSPANFHWDFEGDRTYDITANSNVAQNFIARGTWEYHPTLKVTNAAGTLGFMMSTVVRIQNKAPVAHLGVDLSAVEDQNLTFDASTSQDTTWDMANLTYQFFFGDTTNTSQNSAKVVTHNYSEMGNYSAMLTVTDPYGASDTTSIKVRIDNVFPTVEIIGNSTVVEDGSLTLDAKGNDTPTDISKGLTYKWNFGDGGSTGWLSNALTRHSFKKAGEYNITVLVKDHVNAIGSDNMIVLVTDQPPMAQASVETVYVEEDMLVILGGIGTDTPSDTTEGLQYKWDFGDHNGTEWSTDPATSHTYVNNGTYTAKLFVKDPEGLEGNDTIMVYVTNMPPSAELVDIPTDITEDQTVKFVGKGMDTPTDMLSLMYKWDFGDGTGSPWGLSPKASHEYTRSGEMSIVFYVRDNDNSTVLLDATLRVTNPSPQATIVKPTNTAFDEDAWVTFEGNATDNWSDLSTLNYTWTIDGKDYYSKRVDHVFTVKGSYEATLTVTDDEKAVDKEAIIIKVSNVQPTASLTASSKIVNKSESITFYAFGTDTPSDKYLLKFTWDCGPGNTLQGAGKPTASCTFNTVGLNTVTVVVTDDEGATATARVDVTVKAKGGSGGGGLPVAAIAAAVVVVIVVVLVVLFLLLRKGGRASSEKMPVVEKEDVTPKPKISKVPKKVDEAKGDMKAEKKEIKIAKEKTDK